MGLPNLIMGFNRHTLIPLLLSSTLYTTLVRGCDIPTENAIPCPVRWCDNPETDFLCEPSDNSSFNGVSASTCDSRTTQVFSHPGAHTTVTLFQANETWQHSPSRDPVLTALHSATNDSLVIFGTHAGTADLPLLVRATVSLAADPARKPVQWQNAFNKALHLPSHGNICDLSIVFPPESSPVTPLLLLQLQRHVIRNLYYCVVQYHHPWMWWSLLHEQLHDSLGTPCGAQALRISCHGPAADDARGSRGPGFLTGGVPRGVLRRGPAAASADGVGDPVALGAAGGVDGGGGVAGMAGHEETSGWDGENKVLATDLEFRELFHGFGRKYVERGIRYAAANRAIAVIRPEPVFNFEFWWKADVVEEVVKFETAEDSVDLVPGLQVRPWVVAVVEVPVAREQIVNASMAIGDYVIGYDGNRRNLTEEERGKLAGDLQWSYRRKGTVELTRGPQAGTNSWARIATRSAENATLAEQEEPMVFEFVLTVTGDYMEAPVVFKVEPDMI